MVKTKEQINFFQEKAFVREFPSYWVTLEDIKKYKEQAQLEYSNHWVYRQVYHEKVEKWLLQRLNRKEDVFHDLKMANYIIWLWMYKIQEKDLGFHYFSESVKWEVKSEQIHEKSLGLGLKYEVSIYWFEDLPEKFQHYKELWNKKYSLSEFLEKMPIPIREVCDETWKNLLFIQVLITA